MSHTPQTYVLLAKFEFQDDASKKVFLDVFEPLAEYTRRAESQTFAYELSVSEDDPKTVIIVER